MKNLGKMSAVLLAFSLCVGLSQSPYFKNNSYNALELTSSTTKDLSMNSDDTITCKLPEDFNTEEALFANTDDSVATYSAISNNSFTITGLKGGSSVITLTDGSYNYTLNVTVAQMYDTEIQTNTNAVNLTVQDKSSLPTANRTITNYAKLKNVAVSSSSTSIATATLSDDGTITITGKSYGKVNIIIEADNCSDVKIPVNVYEDIKGDTEIELSKDGPYKLYLDGTKTQLIEIENYEDLAGSVEGKIDDTDIATVTMYENSFKIKGLEEGKTTLTLSCDGADDLKVKIYVYDSDDDDDDDDDDDTTTEITKITYEDDSITLAEGKSKTPSITLKPKKVSDKYLKFKSEDTDIATVSTSGKITAVSKGTTYIKAYYSKDSDIYDEIKVVVNKADSSTSNEVTNTIKTNSTSALASDIVKLPYCLPVGTYKVSSLLGIDSSRLKSDTIDIVAGVNKTNIVLDNVLYNVSIQGVNFSSGSLNFTDVKATHWAYLPIVEAINKGYMDIAAPSVFAPNTKLDYGDTFIALSKMLVQKNKFSILTDRNTIDEYMAGYSTSNEAYLYHKDLMSRLPAKEAKRYTEPGETIYNSGISRIHMANILYVLTSNKNLANTGKVYTFKDVTSTDMLNYISGTGLMVGDDKGNFNPNMQLSRAELAVILQRLEKLL